MTLRWLTFEINVSSILVTTLRSVSLDQLELRHVVGVSLQMKS